MGFRTLVVIGLAVIIGQIGCPPPGDRNFDLHSVNPNVKIFSAYPAEYQDIAGSASNLREGKVNEINSQNEISDQIFAGTEQVSKQDLGAPLVATNTVDDKSGKSIDVAVESISTLDGEEENIEMNEEVANDSEKLILPDVEFTPIDSEPISAVAEESPMEELTPIEAVDENFDDEFPFTSHLLDENNFDQGITPSVEPNSPIRVGIVLSEPSQFQTNGEDIIFDPELVEHNEKENIEQTNVGSQSKNTNIAVGEMTNDNAEPMAVFPKDMLPSLDVVDTPVENVNSDTEKSIISAAEMPNEKIEPMASPSGTFSSSVDDSDPEYSQVNNMQSEGNNLLIGEMVNEKIEPMAALADVTSLINEESLAVQNTDTENIDSEIEKNTIPVAEMANEKTEPMIALSDTPSLTSNAMETNHVLNDNGKHIVPKAEIMNEKIEPMASLPTNLKSVEPISENEDNVPIADNGEKKLDKYSSKIGIALSDTRNDEQLLSTFTSSQLTPVNIIQPQYFIIDEENEVEHEEAEHENPMEEKEVEQTKTDILAPEQSEVESGLEEAQEEQALKNNLGEQNIAVSETVNIETNFATEQMSSYISVAPEKFETPKENQASEIEVSQNLGFVEELPGTQEQSFDEMMTISNADNINAPINLENHKEMNGEKKLSNEAKTPVDDANAAKIIDSTKEHKNTENHGTETIAVKDNPEVFDNADNETPIQVTETKEPEAKSTDQIKTKASISTNEFNSNTDAETPEQESSVKLVDNSAMTEGEVQKDILLADPTQNETF